MAAPFHLILLATMVVSLIWGLVIFFAAFNNMSNSGQLLQDVLQEEGLSSDLELVRDSLKNRDGVDIIPYATINDIPANLDIELHSMGTLGIVAGLAVILFSLFGMFAAFKRIPILLIGLIAVIAIAILIELAVIVMLGASDTDIHKTAKDNLASMVREQYKVLSKRTFDKVLNSVMLVEHCCGIKGPSDFYNLTYTNPEGHTVLFSVPPACCNVKGIALGTFAGRAHHEILACAQTDLENNDYIYKSGCYDKMFIEIADRKGSTFLAVLGLIILWQVLQVVLAVLVILQPSEADEVVEEPKKKVDDSETRRRQFMPFSKISSFVGDDVNRIKSTEIW